jgi:hypothetical protein
VSEPRSLSSLSTADEVSVSLRGFLSPARIVELAEAGFVPSWKVDGGPLMFRKSEVREYVERHLLSHSPGAPFPRALPVVDVCEHARGDVPSVLHAIADRLRPVPVQYPSGVYFLIAGPDVVYVGQAVNVYARIAQHMRDPGKMFDRALYMVVPESDLDGVEMSFIRALRPRLNRKGLEKIRRGAEP